MNSLQHIFVLHSVQKSTHYIDFMDLLVFFKGQNILEDQEFFLSLLNLELQ